MLIMSPSALPQTGVTAERENACQKATSGEGCADEINKGQ